MIWVKAPIITRLRGNTSPLDVGRNTMTSKRVHVYHEQRPSSPSIGNHTKHGNLGSEAWEIIPLIQL